ncbi:MAG: 50S ribosomal protein L10 [Christensenellaceae bacterium]|jgi:large subunit ribosomal protein L10|nr:50S ribosomal protein L10 [Christensenellaceae bacterium]
MASSTIREQKSKHVAEIQDQLANAKSIMLIDYKGVTVAQDSELRNAFRANGVIYRVLKNRLVKIAFNNLGRTEFDVALNGTTSIAMGTTDIVAPAKITVEKSNVFKKMSIKCGLVDGIYMDAEQCKVLAQLPPKEIILSQLLGVLQAPIAAFARVIDAIATKMAEPQNSSVDAI